jgi:hypothetical protein
MRSCGVALRFWVTSVRCLFAEGVAIVKLPIAYGWPALDGLWSPLPDSLFAFAFAFVLMTAGSAFLWRIRNNAA